MSQRKHIGREDGRSFWEFAQVQRLFTYFGALLSTFPLLTVRVDPSFRAIIWPGIGVHGSLIAPEISFLKNQPIEGSLHTRGEKWHFEHQFFAGGNTIISFPRELKAHFDTLHQIGGYVTIVNVKWCLKCL